jgi:glycosyltransferase involved in cell wall biosynthesis
MKIVYLLHWREGTIGVFIKIRNQIAVWNSCGHQVLLIVICPRTEKEINIQFHKEMSFISVKIISYSSLYDLTVRCGFRISKSVRAFKPDIIYWRIAFYCPGLLLTSLGSPIIVETNNNHLAEYWKSSYLKYFIFCTFLYLMKFRILAFFHTSSEVSKLNYFRNFKCPHFVIANSVRNELFDRENLKPSLSLSLEPNFIFVGTRDYPWNGIDKVLEMADIFKEWKFNIVGEFPIDSMNQHLSNITYHGLMDQNELSNIYRKSDFGIGPLSLWKNDMHEASPLKTREYLAFGLPVIGAYQDTDFNETDNFYLRLPNSNEPITFSKSKIESFVKFWYGKRVERSTQIRFSMTKKESLRCRIFMLLMRQTMLLCLISMAILNAETSYLRGLYIHPDIIVQDNHPIEKLVEDCSESIVNGRFNSIYIWIRSDDVLFESSIKTNINQDNDIKYVVREQRINEFIVELLNKFRSSSVCINAWYSPTCYKNSTSPEFDKSYSGSPDWEAITTRHRSHPFECVCLRNSLALNWEIETVKMIFDRYKYFSGIQFEEIGYDDLNYCHCLKCSSLENKTLTPTELCTPITDFIKMASAFAFANHKTICCDGSPWIKSDLLHGRDWLSWLSSRTINSFIPECYELDRNKFLHMISDLRVSLPQNSTWILGIASVWSEGEITPSEIGQRINIGLKNGARGFILYSPSLPTQDYIDIIRNIP